MSTQTQSMIKDLKNGNSFCQICSIQVKNKVLTAHINGKKHRDGLAHLKKQLNQGKEAAAKTQLKRKPDSDLEYPQVKDTGAQEPKRIKNDDAGKNGGTTSNEEYNVKTPWQADVRKRQEEDERTNLGSHVIEGVPRGFFDDERMNSRVRETIEKEKQISTELDKFYKEVEEIEVQKEDEHDQLLEVSAIRADLEVIDEEIERWRSVNQLEIEKEALAQSVASNFEQEPNFDPIDEDEADIDFDKINWRTKFF